ncbi:hypothetical protein PHYSODRAFT_308019 [Phytophthora sojae]|uniref:Uncharacterized protein n=1 Tax=Phytophthora sojae (strain P6497) TaxID=1094619 RepID=G5AHR3_PHYSP|nr:hypothetical protein PHYSODRAFT_295662 [Phytophthora sojae]XP_009539614.1 hypothetical protein PHYSODRAFT_308019 [Phytophthora sojae]EGZ04984.1 hypothetical protein PHYSODRAFT_308019 [Phytophthora sojae]EGZ23127.1 hypothetical protein PHYSODRAFT_295662 [Phytophthora sojae]|eukprot:XP_009518415.1 hypothetical protein PHYSODRAFT_295662 [Phytophthora sojae]
MRSVSANAEPALVSPKKEALPISWAEVLPAAESSTEADFSDIDMAEIVTSETEAAQHQPTTQDTLHVTNNDDDVSITGVKPTEMHYPLQLWLEALGGEGLSPTWRQMANAAGQRFLLPCTTYTRTPSN